MKLKKLLASVLAFVMLGSTGAFALDTGAAEPGRADGLTAGETLSAYVAALGENDWERYIELTAECDRDETEAFLRDEHNAADAVGVFAVNGAKLLDARVIEPDDVYSRYVPDYDERHEKGEATAYLAVVDISVTQESRYFYNGPSPFVVMLARENGVWRVYGFSVASGSVLKSAYDGVALSNDAGFSVERLLEMANLRYKKGIWENYAGEVFLEDNFAETLREHELGASAEKQAANSSSDDHERPGDIRIGLYNSSGVRYKTVEVDLYDAMKNILPNEWGTTWPSESLKAGAQCVKMVIWWLVYNPQYTKLGIDMKNNNDGHYLPDTENAACTRAINAVGGLGMESSDGEIFYASYAAGTSGKYGTESSGRCSQWGTKAQADDGADYFDILSYYYSYSSKSSGKIAEFEY